MIGDQRVLAWIPARSYSKRIPNKNIKDFCGKPLIFYSIDAAMRCKYVDEVFVSTDSEIIARVAKYYGASVPFLRPKRLASDFSKTIEAVIDSLEKLSKHGSRFDIMCLLQPTSPLRTASEIDDAIEAFVKNGCVPLASVSRINKDPSLFRFIDGKTLISLEITQCEESGVAPQELSCYEINGAIYINRIDELNCHTDFNKNPFAFFIPPERGIDIDTENDFVVAEFLYHYLSNY